MTKRRLNNLGFTLAEVLITLGVIGLVAAMTMPTLMSNYRKQVAETRLAKFYSVMNQAIAMSETVNGPKEYWENWESGFEQDEDGNDDYSQPKAVPFFDTYLKPYIKTDKIVYPHDGIYKIVVYFPDGSLAEMAGDGITYYIDSKYYKLIDTDGTISVDITDSGTKYFSFRFKPAENDIENIHHYKKGFEPYKYGLSANFSEDVIKNNNNFGCQKELPRFGRAYCTALIQMNGWKIPKDYPLKF